MALLECLPQAVRDRLDAIILENEYDSAELSIDRLATGEIGSSCIITIKQAHRRLFRLFVKFLVPSESAFSTQAEEYFHNELVFYSEILKQFKGELMCVPKCYGVGKDEAADPFIMMEDLEGYVGLNVKESLSVDSARLILEQLGRFHAHSFAVKDQCEFHESTSKLNETLFTLTNKRIFLHGMHDAFKLLKTSLPHDSFYVKRFADFILGVYDCLVELCQDDEEYKVVTHGDLWPNNILWNKTRNKVKFIDFQGLRYSSPVHDLMMVLLIGLDKATRESHRADLIKVYHDSLCSQLQDLNCDPVRIFPISALQSQIIKHTKFTMGVALAGLPLLFNEEEIIVTNTSGDEAERIYEFLQEVRRIKSVKCKSKMLEIIMDVIDQGCL